MKCINYTIYQINIFQEWKKKTDLILKGYLNDSIDIVIQTSTNNFYVYSQQSCCCHLYFREEGMNSEELGKLDKVTQLAWTRTRVWIWDFMIPIARTFWSIPLCNTQTLINVLFCSASIKSFVRIFDKRREKCFT